MSEQTSQEPTMEEILASIRRIISEDDAPAAAPGEAAPLAAEAEPEVEAPPAPAAEPEPMRAKEPAPEPQLAPVEAVADIEEDEEDALELTEKVETHGDLDVLTAPPAAVAKPAPPPPVMPAVETLVSASASSAAASAFGQLSAAMAMPAGDRTLEDVVRELLRPLLQQWLDDNLPAIVQQTVEAEVDRIARGRVR